MADQQRPSAASSPDIEVPNVAGKANPKEQARMAAMIGSLKEQQNSQVLVGRKGEDKVLENVGNLMNEDGSIDLKSVPTVYLNQCEDCNYTINHRTAKIFMESCKNVTVTVSGQILTHTMEIWKCSGSTVYLKTGCKTIQLDLMEDMTLRFEDRDHMGAIVWQAVDDLKLRFDNDAEQDLDTGFAHMKEKYPDSVKEVDQYIIRHLGEEKVLTPERCIRLKNGFLSTDREAHDWEVRNEKIKHDYVERYLKEAGIHLRRSKEKVIPRNSPCPCGSGKKYKKCCINKRELTGVVSREEQLENASKPIQSGASIVDGQTRSADEVVEKAAEMLGEQLARQKLQQQQQQ